MEKEGRYKGKLQSLINATNKELDLTRDDLEDCLRRLKDEIAINEVVHNIISAYTEKISSTDENGLITLSKKLRVCIFNFITDEERIDYNIRWQYSKKRDVDGERIKKEITEIMVNQNKTIEIYLRNATQMNFEIVTEKVELDFEYGHYGRKDIVKYDCIDFTKSYCEITVNLK